MSGSGFAQISAWTRNIGMGCALLLLPGSSWAADAPQYVASRDILLAYQTAKTAVIDQADLWVSTDNGQTWRIVEAASVGSNGLRYLAPADGRYDFYFVLHNAFGVSAPPPTADSKPHSCIVVDTLAPAFQVHRAESLADASGRILRLRTSLIEENLGETGIRVFYRTLGDTPWTDGGSVPLQTGYLLWRVPAAVEQLAGLRVIVTDLAGNQTLEEIRSLPKLPPPAAVASPPARPVQKENTGSAALVEHPELSPPRRLERPNVGPSQIERAPRVSLEEKPVLEKPVPPPASMPAAGAGSSRTLLQFHELASRHLADGQYNLAAARLEDALAQEPQNADLLVDLGRVLQKAGRPDDARQRFQAALRQSPDHLGALDGVALVAVTQRRYTDARAHLRHLLRLQAESGKYWLRYGDNEYRLGETDEAARAWQKALEAKEASAEDRASARRKLDYFGPARGTTQP